MSNQIPEIAVYTTQLSQLCDKINVKRYTLKHYNIPYPFKGHTLPLYQNLQQKEGKKSLKVKWQGIQFNGNYFIFKFTCESYFNPRIKQGKHPYNELQHVYVIMPLGKDSSVRLSRNSRLKQYTHYFNFSNKYYLYFIQFDVTKIYFCESTESVLDYFMKQHIGKSWLIYSPHGQNDDDDDDDDDDHTTATTTSSSSLSSSSSINSCKYKSKHNKNNKNNNNNDDNNDNDNDNDNNDNDNNDNESTRIKEKEKEKEKEDNLRIQDIYINVTEDEFCSILRKRRKGRIHQQQLLASFLLDQSIFSGLGDYLVSEILYASQLRYSLPIIKLSSEQEKQLYKYITEYILKSYGLDGVANRYLDNEKGEFTKTFQIYNNFSNSIKQVRIDHHLLFVS